jgi:HEAT repeat protein
MRTLITHLETDPDPEVRSGAAQALGRFVLAGEMGQLAESTANDAVDALLTLLVHGDEHPEVHRRALESVAYASREEIASLIEEALEDLDVKMRASAVFAMGRSANERWAETVLSALQSDEEEIVYEATRAAGDLMLEEAVHDLIRLSTIDDTEIQMSAIWSLGEIGGKEARQALMELADSHADDPVLDAIEDALNMAALSTGEFATYLFSSDDESSDRTDLFDEFDEE